MSSTIAGTWLPTNIIRSRNDGEVNKDVKETAERFRERFDGKEATVEARKGHATTLVNEYYDLVTDFYEYGWGQAFHFAPRYKNETFYESLARHETYLAHRGGFVAGHRVIDVGCGVGGPLRNMVRFSGAHVTGINNNEYQIRRANRYDTMLGLDGLTDYIKTDFCNMPIESATLDGAYAIEATCHAEDKRKCYGEIFRVLKPGASFVAYEWIITDTYDDSNEEHRRIRHGIELGNALPTLETAGMIKEALQDVGFVVEDMFDVVDEFEKLGAKQIPWYTPLAGSYSSVQGWRSTPVGRWCTTNMVRTFEFLHIAPAGSTKTADILEEAAVNLVLGGEKKIFSPCLFFKATKPRQ